jgi:hypothetical protein
MTRRYPVLRFFVILSRIAGILLIGLAIMTFCAVTVVSARAGFYVSQADAVIIAVACMGSMGGVLNGLGLLALAEWVMLHIDLEENTRAVRAAARRLIPADRQPEWARDPAGMWADRD